MKQGHISQYFRKIVAKRLSAVESNISKSNQHEFNGTKELKQVFGDENGSRRKFPTHFVWIGEENETLSSDGFVTWYDARLNHATRSEFRLYFPTTEVSSHASEGDLMILAQKTDRSILILVVAAGSTIENQLIWLFGLDIGQGLLFIAQEINDSSDKEIDFVVRFILEEIGIEVGEPEYARLDSLVEPFNCVFPSTSDFSLFARNTLKDVCPVEEPDKTLMRWMDQEEKLFRRLERQIVTKRISEGFVRKDSTDVDGFISFSLSVQNRRKSRAGYALEHHLSEIFKSHGVLYTRQGRTENKAKPDFIFPGIAEYHTPEFSSALLTMMGVKTSLKDRWRQVVTEADRINNKHLLTLEPGISENQTTEMQSHNLQLVIPKSIHATFSDNQQKWLIDLKEFIDLVREKQESVM